MQDCRSRGPEGTSSNPRKLEGLKMRCTDQQGGRFVELDVHRGLAPAQRVVIHAGQIIVHQRVGVDHLDGAGRRVEAVRIAAAGSLIRQLDRKPSPQPAR